MRLSLSLPLSALSFLWLLSSALLQTGNLGLQQNTADSFRPGALALAVPAALSAFSPGSLLASSLVQDWSLFPSHLLSATHILLVLLALLCLFFSSAVPVTF